jgi:transcriptional regulator with XRE-family HTH domain
MAYKVDADNEFAKALGVVLRTLRKVRGHKVIVVHKVTGFSETSIASWEIGRYMPSIQNLRALAEFYRVPMSTIITNAEKTIYLMEKGNKSDRDE